MMQVELDSADYDRLVELKARFDYVWRIHQIVVYVGIILAFGGFCVWGIYVLFFSDIPRSQKPEHVMMALYYTLLIGPLVMFSFGICGSVLQPTHREKAEIMKRYGLEQKNGAEIGFEGSGREWVLVSKK